MRYRKMQDKKCGVENAGLEIAGPGINTSSTSTSPATEVCEVCLPVPRDGVALLQCGYIRFYSACADRGIIMVDAVPR